MGRVFTVISGLVLIGLGWAINDPSLMARMGVSFDSGAFVVSITAIVVGGLGALLLLDGVAGYLRTRAARLPPPQTVAFTADNFSHEAPPEPAPFPAASRERVDGPPSAPPPQPFPATTPAPAIVVEPTAEAATEGPPLSPKP